MSKIRAGIDLSVNTDKAGFRRDFRRMFGKYPLFGYIHMGVGARKQKSATKSEQRKEGPESIFPVFHQNSHFLNNDKSLLISK
ncbi:hypothetical protein ACQV5M_15535 [Leptospira sp. SA-E8]|uniref:hypothetical protein n=1 Tax=Leptospira sp. SA-E8 TaxID=3422259 RepID=UPI003EB9FACA